MRQDVEKLWSLWWTVKRRLVVPCANSNKWNGRQVRSLKREPEKQTAKKCPPGVGTILKDWQHPAPATRLHFYWIRLSCSYSPGCGKKSRTISRDCYLGLGYHYSQINQKLIKERFKKKTAKGSQAKPIVIPGGQRLCMLKTASSEKWYQRLHTAVEWEIKMDILRKWEKGQSITTFSSNSRPPECMKQNATELKGEIDNSTIIDGHISSPLLIMDRVSRQKINKHGRLEQHYELTKFSRHLQNTPPNKSKILFLLKAHKTFSRRNYMLGLKINFKELQLHKVCFPVTVEWNWSYRVMWGIHKSVEIKALLSNQRITEEITKE